MNFIKHIFSGHQLVLTLVFNPLILFYFYELIFVPESFYEGMAFPGTVVAVGVYSMYWAYCIKAYRDNLKYEEEQKKKKTEL